MANSTNFDLPDNVPVIDASGNTAVPWAQWFARVQRIVSSVQSHLSVLASGRVLVSVDGVETEHAAPAFLTIAAGKAHEVTALTDVVWGCLHATDCTDADKIDHELVHE
jgi:hypothetical protein